MSAALVLPVSLSPHVCIFPSSDLIELLEDSSLPPVHHLLQAFSPLPQVTTRTTTLTTVTHATFPLRFSDYRDVDIACKEDENSRAGRTIDWISQRIAKRAPAWIERAEKENFVKNKNLHTPWWLELERCIEGDHTPSRHEGWNHPVAVILATSTLAPNPLQAITELHNKYNEIQLPPWVDSVRLRHTLIIHPTNSPLNSDEAMALYNAIKKQYGLHTHLLAVSLSPPEAPVMAPSLLPELPLSPLPDAAFSKPSKDRAEHLNLSPEDVSQFARFVREFTTMSLVPWMERYAMEWNETYMATRRFSSKIFSSTKKWFGGSSSTAIPSSPTTYGNTTSAYSSNPVVSPTSSSSGSSPHQLRRLAEFATFLGDIKLAVSVWETLRKEGRGGSEILPLLLAPSPAQAAHAVYTLSALQQGDLGPSSQLRGMTYAVRWGAGVRDLDLLGGERWLEMAAGLTEEPPLAILLAQAALISARKGAIRRAAMWYALAAQRMEKSGIKPLTVYFYQMAHNHFCARPRKDLSPLFDDAYPRKDAQWFDAILPSIEYSLGRLMYTSGDSEGALRFFLGLLRGSSSWNYADGDQSLTDALYIGDFKVAFEHLKSTVGNGAFPSDLHLPFSLCHPGETKIRLAHEGSSPADSEEWQTYKQRWSEFWKSRGKERIEESGKAAVGERFWVDIMLKNPLDMEVNLTNVTVKVESSNSIDRISIETIDEIFLRPKESRIVPITISSDMPTTLKITHLTHSFLSLLPVSESLAVRGPRLQQTIVQRRSVVYGPDRIPSIDIQEDGRRLELSFTRSHEGSRKVAIAVGECAEYRLTLKNAGRGKVDDIWILHNPSAWIDIGETGFSSEQSGEINIMKSSNTPACLDPLYIPLQNLNPSSSLLPGDSVELRVIIRSDVPGFQAFTSLLVYREKEHSPFFTSKLRHLFDVVPILELGASVRPSTSTEMSYTVNLEFENISDASDMKITQVVTTSADWICTTDGFNPISIPMSLPPSQAGRVFLRARRHKKGTSSIETLEFVTQQLTAILEGRQIPKPPPLDVTYSYIKNPANVSSANNSGIQDLIELSRRSYTQNILLEQFHQLSPRFLSNIFPVRHPQSLDIIVFWEIPSEKRLGFSMLPGLFLGAYHAPLNDVFKKLETAKVKRIMYAETAREKAEIQGAIRNSEWNAEMDPLVIRATSHSRIQHNFSESVCVIPVTFTIRNFSLTNYTRYTLRLQGSDALQTSDAQILPPNYVGLLTHRGTVEPLSYVQVKTKMWASRPGIYGLNGWRLETEVGGQTVEPWQTRSIFQQESSWKEESIVVVIHQES